MPETPSQPTRRKNNAEGDGARAARRRRRPQQYQRQDDASSATHQAQSITASLLRTKNMMSQELDRATSLNTTINDDGAMLHDAREEHEGMGGTMLGARKVMGRLGRQDVRDAVVLRCAICFYWATVAYVLWTRIKVPFLP
mmetsp:Transcript_45888/g.97481  ORF Transcript_45888/g.97481 Transcript_45888/m.97481 type:complete len:141 (+) Transcript_45888:166-588(+)